MIRPLHFVDTALMTARLLTRWKDNWGEEADGVSLFPLRNGGQDVALLKDFQAAKSVLSAIRKLGPTLLEGKAMQFGDVVLERIAPGAYLQWTAAEGDHADGHYRLELPLVTSPSCMSYCGTAGLNPAVGALCLVEHHLPCAAVNLGATPWIRMLLEVKKPPVELLK